MYSLAVQKTARGPGGPFVMNTGASQKIGLGFRLAELARSHTLAGLCAGTMSPAGWSFEKNIEIRGICPAAASWLSH